MYPPEVFIFPSQTQINVLNITEKIQRGQNIDTMRYYITQRKCSALTIGKNRMEEIQGGV